MDSTPPEKPKPKENTTQEETIVLKNTIRPFAKGLFQMAERPLRELESGFSSLPNETNTQTQEVISEAQSALNEITTTLIRLRTAKEVKIVKYGEETEEYKLIFSEECEEEETPPEGEADPPAPQVVRAVFDRLGNKLTEVVGYTELLSVRGTNEDIREKMMALNALANEINNKWGSIRQADYQIKISTDPQGNTTITPIPRPNP